MTQRLWPLLAWLVYFLMPFDILPDHFFGPGWTDDLILLGLVYYFFLRQGAPGGSRTGSRKTEEKRDRSGAYRQDGAERSDERADRNKPKNPYEILSIEPGADPDTIKKAYHRMAAKYHPDKVSHLGEEFQQLAKEKFQEIQWAYETLIHKNRERGK
ncbi:MAG: DnaJ domain-containing protein [Desulfosoma sp.]